MVPPETCRTRQAPFGKEPGGACLFLRSGAIRKTPPIVTAGAGDLKFTGHELQVDYEITGQMRTLASAHVPLRGLLRTAPDVAEALFRAGEAALTLDDGRGCRIRMLGYTSGSDTAYFEIRI